MSLEEPADEGHRVVPPYHAYAPSGGAVAEAVFVNLGREEDYVALERLGVGVRGRVAVARRGGGYRGGVVARAAEKGAVAVLIAGNADGGVERGVVLLGGPGDPLTPGWAATGGAERLGFDAQAVVLDYPMLTSTALLDPFDNLARSNASLCGRTFACFLSKMMHARPWDSCHMLATCSMFCFYEMHATLRSPNGYTDYMAHLITTPYID